jgi:putative spermidine/putrescine transport system substrate-binding protein
VGTHNYDWDVVDFELADAMQACSEGLLAPIDAASLPAGADGASPRDDFFKNALGPCWIGSVVFAQVIAFAPNRFRFPPANARDFFDLDRFPGPRAIHRASAKFNVELALLADGVKPQDVYPTLSTPAGVERALAKLSTIRRAIVWWTRPDEPLQLLADGSASMVTALNGNVFDAQTHGLPVGVIWDDALYELDVFGIPKGDPRTDRGVDFIRFATGAAPLARVASWVPFGPARRSAQALVGRNPVLGIAMGDMLPTSPQNAQTAFAIDDAWWQAHGRQIAAMWRRWLAHGS